jgi:MoaA/NifB/PqqE/SkfB family radical SAM enzyme
MDDFSKNSHHKKIFLLKLCEIMPNIKPVLQIHLTRRCNLSCFHCYSVSGPEEQDELNDALLLQAITDASNPSCGLGQESRVE